MGEEACFPVLWSALILFRYSRINGAGAFVTTYGPGELSAYCGHAGAYAEFCKVVHIVGYPGRDTLQRELALADGSRRHCYEQPHLNAPHLGHWRVWVCI